MSVLTFPQFFDGSKLGTPSISAVAGDFKTELLQVLDACLVTGYGFVTAASQAIVGDAIVLTFGVTHPYTLHQFVTIKGADNPDLNANHRVIAVTETSISIAKGSITNLTGSLTVNVTPLGWESMFGTTDGTRRAYRSADLTSSRTVLYLDTNYVATNVNKLTSGKTTKVTVCEDMTTLGVPIKPYTPPLGSGDGVHHWISSMGTALTNNLQVGAALRKWFLIGDGKMFYLLIPYQSNKFSGAYEVARAVYLFGDLSPITAEEEDPLVVLGSSNVSTGFFVNPTYGAEYLNPTGAFMGINNSKGLSILKRDRIGDNSLVPAFFSGSSTYENFQQRARSGREGLAARQVGTEAEGIAFTYIPILENTGPKFRQVMPYLRFVLTNLTVSKNVPNFDLNFQGGHTIVGVTGGQEGGHPDNWAYLAFNLFALTSEENP